MLSKQAEAVLAVLKAACIEYHLEEHSPVYTIDEMAALGLPDGDAVAKNLFLRDDKKRTYYLVVIRQEKTANLKALRQTLGSRPLSFASEDDLWKYLKLTKGAITPLGALNDETKSVIVVFDKDFIGNQIAVHPNDNRASVWMQADDLIRLIKAHGNPVVIAEI